MSKLLSQAELDRISAKVAEVEAKTAGEIVVHVVERSSNYGFARALYASAAAYLIIQAVVLVDPFAHTDIHLADWALPAIPILAVLGWWLLGVPALLSRVLSSAIIDDTVHRRAQLAFIENRVHRTADASGVLILVSELEHRVEILADEGIHARVGAEGWGKQVDQIIAEIKQGRAAEGLLRATDEIGRELADGFPPRAGDVNELPDEVIRTPR